jgi:hypothetical protein
MRRKASKASCGASCWNGQNKRKRNPKTVLKLPDLEQSKSAVLNSRTSQSSQRSYDYAIRELIDWYCSEPRLAFNKTVVTRYRISFEQAHYASSIINLRLAAVRRLAYEAADCGLRSPDLAAGIRRVKGLKKHGHADRQLADSGTLASASLPGSTRAVSAANEIMLWLPSCWDAASEEQR